MALNSTTYPNISRVVSGAAILSPNDGILLCNTSTAPVTMTLLEIPANYWQTTWRLYVLDNSNNAGTNNITISVPSGYTINNASTLVINTNGGGVVVTIASNTSFFGQVSPLPVGGGGTITAVTGTAPVVSSGGTSPAISIPVANGSTDGYLSSANWTTFNTKVTSVGATLPMTSTGGTTPQIAMPSASASNDGFLLKGDWSTFNGKVSSVTASLPLSATGGTSPNITIAQATTSTSGYLSDTDWDTFNNKSEVISASNTGGVVVATCTNFRFKTTDFTTTSPSSGVALVEAVQFEGFLAQGTPPSLTRVIPSSANTIFTAGTTLLTAEIYDDGFDYNPVNGIWTCPADGRYNISFWAHYSVGGGSWLSGMFTAGIMNGATTGQYCGAWASVTQATPHVDVSGSVVGLDLTAGNTLCMVVLNQLDSNYTSTAGDVVRFSVQRIR